MYGPKIVDFEFQTRYHLRNLQVASIGNDGKATLIKVHKNRSVNKVQPVHSA